MGSMMKLLVVCLSVFVLVSVHGEEENQVPGGLTKEDPEDSKIKMLAKWAAEKVEGGFELEKVNGAMSQMVNGVIYFLDMNLIKLLPIREGEEQQRPMRLNCKIDILESSNGDRTMGTDFVCAPLDGEPTPYGGPLPRLG